jgi:parallel beta-helix repeat protein
VSRKVPLVMAFVIILGGMPLLSFTSRPTKAKTIVVPNDHSTIQEAINAASNGDTIYVKNGTYYGSVIVNKTISLVGESSIGTIVDGKGTGTVMKILTNRTVVRSFNINDSGTSLGDMGISLIHASNVTIEENIIANTGGVYLLSSDNNTLSNNIVSDNWYGVYLSQSRQNNLTKNNVRNNNNGIEMYESNDNLLKNNTIDNNVYNLDIDGGYTNEIDTTNSINGKPVCYLINRENLVINPSTFPKIGYLAVINSTKVTVENVNLAHNQQGILFAFTNHSIVKNVEVSQNFIGIGLVSSYWNIIEHSRIDNNTYGIEIDSLNNQARENNITNNIDGVFINSQNNTLTGNFIANNHYRGLYVVGSRNTIHENTVANNEYGIVIDFYDNSIYHNNFINNLKQASLNMPRAVGIWDDGYPSGGNYWSSYKGADLHGGFGQNTTGSDGIGDTAYSIAANNTDHYPLMGTFQDFNATPIYHVQTICNSSISGFKFNGTTIAFKVTSQNRTVSFCRICIPRALLNQDYRVFVNGTEVPYSLLSCSNTTHNYLYFTLNYTTQEVVILPEFPTFMILPSFIKATLLILVVYRRKHDNTEAKKG